MTIKTNTKMKRKEMTTTTFEKFRDWLIDNAKNGKEDLGLNSLAFDIDGDIYINGTKIYGDNKMKYKIGDLVYVYDDIYKIKGIGKVVAMDHNDIRPYLFIQHNFQTAMMDCQRINFIKVKKVKKMKC